MGKKKQRDPPPKFATSKILHEHFTPFFDDQLNSPAFIALSAVAVRVYLILRQEYKGIYTGNNIKCTYSQIVDKGVSRNSISKALGMLIAFGFITYEQGGLEHKPNVYHFSEKWKEIKTSEDVKRIQLKLKEKEQQDMQRKERAKDKLKLIV